MRRRRLRQLVLEPPSDDGRLFWTGLMFPIGNARPEALVPRLERVDAYRLRGSGLPIVRSVQYRSYVSAAGSAWLNAVLRTAGRRYHAMFATEIRHLRFFPGPAVVDVPDPWFTAQELETLNRPNVRAVVVTASRAGEKYERLGLRTPWHVIRQGVDLAAFAPERVRAVRERVRRPGRQVVGYASAYLFTEGDRLAAHDLYGVDHVLALWDEIHARAPDAELWLLGRAGDRLRTKLHGRDDVRVFGWVPRTGTLAHMAAFDVALYPRPVDVGNQAIKIAEYLGSGTPTVAYRHPGVQPLYEGGGILVDSAEEFVDGVVELLRSDERRRELATEAERIGRSLGWDALAQRLEAEVLDVYLPA